MAEIGVIYLCRCAEGTRPVRNFVESYRAHAAGTAHDLHVIFKGYASKSDLASAQALFADLPIKPIELADKGYDIGSYFAAARQVANRRLIFLNTFSVLLADDWLKKFDAALSQLGVGLVGATGSWQSNRSLYEGSLKRALQAVATPLASLRRWRADVQNQNGDPNTQPGAATALVRETAARQVLGRVSTSFYHLMRFDHYLFNYKGFPNPHIRTNAFMIERARLLALKAPAFFRTKFDVYKFESGRQSLTQQILAQGLRPVVMDCDGRVFDIADWKTASTFWINGQVKLIAADNRTRDYSEGSQRMREQLQAHAWEHPASWVWER